MKPAFLALLLLVPLLHAEASPVMHPPIIGRFEFDQAAIRPPAEVEGIFVIESTIDTTVSGAIVLDDQSAPLVLAPRGSVRANEPTHADEPAPERRVLKEVHEDMEAHTTVRIPFVVPVDEVGSMQVSFDHDSGVEVLGTIEYVVGLAPVDVTIEDFTASLVSVPGRPAEMTVTLTALPGSSLTSLRLSASQIEDIEIGDLPPGQSFTATIAIAVEDDQHPRSDGVSRSELAPVLSGAEAGQNFTHHLYRTNGNTFEEVRPMVYIASSSTAFILPPDNARLKEPTQLEVAILNAGEAPMRVEGRLLLDLRGMSHLRTTFDVQHRVPPGQVGTVTIDWTPPAAGQWNAELNHDVHARGTDYNSLTVAGPVERADLLLPPPMDRGSRSTLEVVLTASEETEVGELMLTSSRAPLHGAISISDLFWTSSVEATKLASGEPVTLEMDVRAKATGSYELYLVVETTEGPSLHHAGALVVHGAPVDWPVAWSPTLGLFLLLGMHMVWRRRFVT